MAGKNSSEKTYTKNQLTTYLLVTVIVILVIIGGVLYFISKPGSSGNSGKLSGSDKVVILEYSDFQCPYCGQVEPIVKQLLSTYGDKVELDYKHFPLTTIHQFAQKAAEASECARAQGKFWQYHDELFAHQDALDLVSLKKYAVDLGLDAAEFNNCLDAGKKANVVAADKQEGVNAGVSSTPTFFIDGEKLVGALPFEQFKQVIDRKLS